MGVYIPGMEMPETCKLCYLSEFDPGFYAYVCKPTGIRIDYDMAKNDRPRTICPLVHVPPHGRLGDLDVAAELVMQYCPDDDGTCSKAGADLRDLLDEIENLPTIIPAEEGE